MPFYKLYLLSRAGFLAILIAAFLVYRKVTIESNSIGVENVSDQGDSAVVVDKHEPITGQNSIILNDLKKQWVKRVSELRQKADAIAVPVGQDTGSYIPMNLTQAVRSGTKMTEDTELASLASVTASFGSSELCSLLIENDRLPPETIDLIIFAAMSRSFEELSKQNAKAALNPWVKMADSKNAVYRLLALKAMGFVSSNGVHNEESPERERVLEDSKLKFALYQRMAADKNNLIAEEAVKKIGYCARYLPEAHSFLVSAAQETNPQLAKIASEELLQLRQYKLDHE